MWNFKLREGLLPALVCRAAVLWNPAAGCSECCVSGPGQLQRVYYRVCKSAGQRNPALHKYGLLRVPRHVGDVWEEEYIAFREAAYFLFKQISFTSTKASLTGFSNIIKTTRHWRYLQTSVPISNMSYMSAPQSLLHREVSHNCSASSLDTGHCTSHTLFSICAAWWRCWGLQHNCSNQRCSRLQHCSFCSLPADKTAALQWKTIIAFYRTSIPFKSKSIEWTWTEVLLFVTM